MSLVQQLVLTVLLLFATRSSVNGKCHIYCQDFYVNPNSCSCTAKENYVTVSCGVRNSNLEKLLNGLKADPDLNTCTVKELSISTEDALISLDSYNGLEHLENLELNSVSESNAVSLVKSDAAAKLLSFVIRGTTIRNLYPSFTSNLINLKFFVLMDNSLRSVEDGAFDSFAANLESLSLYNNRLEVVPKEVIKLERLRFLDLTVNRIEAIDFDLDFKFLFHLDLSRNQIERLKKGFMKGCSRLEFLSLSSNKLEKIHSGFCDSSSLKDVNFYSNKIEVIETDAFKSCGNLEFLNLDSNKLKQIERNVFGTNLPNALQLEENNFHCSCQLRWLEALIPGFYNTLCKTFESGFVDFDSCSSTTTGSRKKCRCIKKRK